MPARPAYDKIVLKEGGYTVELTNQGNKLMFNPNPQNIEKNEVKCIVDGCNETTRNMYALCTEHNKEKKNNCRHTADWFGRVIPLNCTREDVQNDVLPHSKITEILIKWMNNEEKKRIMDDFINDVLKSIVGEVPDATTLQKNLNGELEYVMTPNDLIEMVKNIIDRHFPKNVYDVVKLDGGKFKNKSLSKIPIRIAAALLILAWACEESNRGDALFCKVHDRKSKYGNAYMPSVYYFLRRYTNASEEQARICLK
jgi:hypothetical protein